MEFTPRDPATGLVRSWGPSASTYTDRLTGMPATQRVRRERVRADTPPPDRTGPSDRQLAAVRDLMDQRLAEPLPIADLAASASLRPSRCTRRFRASAGRSLHQFLLRLRPEAACRMLRTGSTPIADVAAACGFSHQEHTSPG